MKKQDNVITEKRCSKCKEIKSVCNFYKDSTIKDGFRSRCKECVKNHKHDNSKTTNHVKNDIINPKWVKECPSCNELIYYKKYISWYGAKKDNKICRNCFYKSRIDSNITKCLNCDKNIKVQRYEIDTHKFCSQKCNGEYKYKTTIRIDRNCKYCDKLFQVPQSLIKLYEGIINIGTFCSRTCLCKYNIEQNQLNGSLNGTNTKPELKFKQILEENNIIYDFQYVIKYNNGKTPYKVFDFYIPDKNILVEIDGVYWHGKNLKYSELNETQKRNRINDRIKNKLAKDMGYKLIRIWEDEITKFNINKIKNE